MRGSAQPGNFKLLTQYSVPDNKEIPSRKKKVRTINDLPDKKTPSFQE